MVRLPEQGEGRLRSSDYWRGMADEARALADSLSTDVNRHQLMEIAKSYDVLAEQAAREEERRATTHPAPPPASPARSS